MAIESVLLRIGERKRKREQRGKGEKEREREKERETERKERKQINETHHHCPYSRPVLVPPRLSMYVYWHQSCTIVNYLLADTVPLRIHPLLSHTVPASLLFLPSLDRNQISSSPTKALLLDHLPLHGCPTLLIILYYA